MTFLNLTMLAGLAVVAIPIIIHLLNRRKAQLVEWGAMRFLLASLASRNRRILIEEMILLVVRCLLLALVALAIARPFLPSTTRVPWALVLPSVLGATLLLAMAGALWSHRLRRWLLLALATALLAVAALSTIMETYSQNARWRAGGEKDVAIIIDGSMSMQLTVDGKSNFQRAIDEARAVVASCRSGDAISIILGTSRPQAVIAAPTCDRKVVEAALESLQAGRGSMKTLEALNLAMEECLSKGVNPSKKIVVITDGQNVGWDAQDEHRWKFLASAMQGGRLHSPPQILCRTLGLPRTFNNLTLAEIAPSRHVVGTDRKLQIDVKVTNTGLSSAQGAAVELAVDGLPPMVEKISNIEPNASETIHFEHKFDAPGRHLLSAQVKLADDLGADNSAWRTIDVLDRLPVLIIDGAPSKMRLEGAAEFMEVALAPQDKSAPASRDDQQCLVETRTVPISELATVKDLSAYRVVVLANVPQLPSQFAQQVEQFVRSGGGLLIAAGSAADRDFYNRWTSAGGAKVCPAELAAPAAAGGTMPATMETIARAFAPEPLQLDVKGLTHPALAKLSESGKSDVASARVSTYWPLKIDARDAYVRTAASLETQSPLLVERKLGKGMVMLSGVSFDRYDSNLPSLRCFVVMMHELVYYLAEPTVSDGNIVAGSPITVDLPAATPGGSPAPAGETAEIVLPSQARRPVLVSAQGRRISFAGSQEPGLYRLMLPDAWYAPLGQQSQAKAGLPFVVRPEPDESRLSELTSADFDRLRRTVDLFRAETIDELITALSGSAPGQELWKYLAIGALLALLAEIALARWIAQQRRTHSANAVAFGQEMLDVDGYRKMAKQMLSEPDAAAQRKE